MSKERNCVNIVCVEVMTPVQTAGRSVVADVERIRHCVEITAHIVDLMGVGVSKLHCEPMLGLHAYLHLECVVTEISLVLFLRDRAEARKLTIQVGGGGITCLPGDAGGAASIKRLVGGYSLSLHVADHRVDQGQRVDGSIVALAPSAGAGILDCANYRPRELTLNPKTEHGSPRVAVVVIQVRHRGREPLTGRCTGQSARIRIRKVNVVCGRLIRKRRVERGVVDIVALDTFEEHAKAAADDHFAVSVYVKGKTKSWLYRCVIILHHTSWKSAHPRFLDAIQIERSAVEGSKGGRVERPIRIERIAGPRVVVGWVEVRKLVVPLESVRHAIVADQQICELQPSQLQL